MQKNNIVISIVAGLILIGGSFYGGMQYGLKSAAAKSKAQPAQNGRNFSGADSVGQRGVGAGNKGGAQGMRGGAVGGGFASGQIVSKDDTSVTIKSIDGSSKIVFFSGATGIDKPVPGTSSDLSVGQQVMINGKANSDGSIVAQTIQIRPAQAAQQNQAAQ